MYDLDVSAVAAALDSPGKVAAFLVDLLNALKLEAAGRQAVLAAVGPILNAPDDPATSGIGAAVASMTNDGSTAEARRFAASVVSGWERG
ncbi:hypothetical protein [Gemmata sp.]|uniref:hypothetical protein n=1 Tax=Gemmata sp. TaxID=1914242 RepID=UPI003F72B84B